jgi:phosphopantetheinyl transferase
MRLILRFLRASPFLAIRPVSRLYSLFESRRVCVTRGLSTKSEMRLWFCQGGLRRIAASYMGCLPEEVDMCRERRGKPYVPGALEFNLTHTAGRMFAAFSSSPVGLDVESASRTVRTDALARKFFSREETNRLDMCEGLIKALTFLRYWVCKEAIVKLSGDGVYYGLRSARVDLASDGRSRGDYKGREVRLWEFRPAKIWLPLWRHGSLLKQRLLSDLQSC